MSPYELKPEVTTDDVVTISRYRKSGLELVIRFGDWEMSRRVLLRRDLDREAWVTHRGERVELTADAARMIAESLNAVRPWEGGW